MNPSRRQKIEHVVGHRQTNVAVLLENIHDFHNVNAIIRSCDAVGIQDVYILYSKPELQQNKIKLGKRSTAGSRKWIDPHLYFDLNECVSIVKAKYQLLIGTHLSSDSKSLYQVDLTVPHILVFGNEKHGISDELLTHIDINIHLPMYGMVSSLNLSVACAVSLYEMLRQREAAGLYQAKNNPLLLENYLERAGSKDAGKGRLLPNID